MGMIGARRIAPCKAHMGYNPGRDRRFGKKNILIPVF
jgi:hypothetical protein